MTCSAEPNSTAQFGRCSAKFDDVWLDFLLSSGKSPRTYGHVFGGLFFAICGPMSSHFASTSDRRYLVPLGITVLWWHNFTSVIARISVLTGTTLLLGADPCPTRYALASVGQWSSFTNCEILGGNTPWLLSVQKVDFEWVEKRSHFEFSPFVDQSSPNLVGMYGSDRSMQRRFPVTVSCSNLEISPMKSQNGVVENYVFRPQNF